jgi:hypothetical protein
MFNLNRISVLIVFAVSTTAIAQDKDETGSCSSRTLSPQAALTPLRGPAEADTKFMQGMLKEKK